MKRFLLLFSLALTTGCSSVPSEQAATQTPAPGQGAEVVAQAATQGEISEQTIIGLLGPNDSQARAAMGQLEESWDDGLAVVILEALFSIPPERRGRVMGLLSSKTGQSFQDRNDWFAWYWNQDKRPPAWYSTFKGHFYAGIDPSFKKYFEGNPKAIIDLTEIRWGGVRRDGIPPLDHPKMLKVEEASYLADTDVVFGIVNKGDARAYPKRILAWHEMFRDEIGGDSIAGVYCTLCGTMIPYLAEDFVIGTSGFLYRSNKLMYDLKTRSMWSTTDGRPVVGELVDKGIKLKSIAVVTTTWGEWKRRHPDTTVLSLETGHKRDYGEGVAYSDYFSTDELMFNTPKTDPRLLNKAEVLLPGFSGDPLAIDSSFLEKNPVYHDRKGDTDFVVLTDNSGANRIYESKDLKFSNYADDKVVDQNGKQWKVLTDRLQGDGQDVLKRLPAHRAFWFGWYAAHPDTKLVK